MQVDPVVYQLVEYYPYVDDDRTWGVFLLPTEDFPDGAWCFTDVFDRDGNLLANVRLVTSKENAEASLAHFGEGYEIREYTE